MTNEHLQYGANEAAEHSNPDWPRFIRITDINENGTLKDDTFRSLPRDVAKEYHLLPGDLLFARSGATVGKTFIYDELWGKACFAGYLIRFRSNLARAYPKYIYLFTLSSLYQQWRNGVLIKQQFKISVPKSMEVSLYRYRQEMNKAPSPPSSTAKWR